MRTLRVVIMSVAVIFLLVQISPAKNGNIGIYGIVDKVVLEPDENAPERIQIWGFVCGSCPDLQRAVWGSSTGDSLFQPPC
jgi:hypothetical protein